MPNVEYYQNLFAKEKGDLAQTVLITGPYGAGKSFVTDLIRRRFLSAEQISKEEDTLTVDIPGNKTRISLERIQAMREFLSRSPLFGPYKFAVVHHADFMTTEAQNALLKTLEEPSPSAVIVLVSSYGRVLPTICSRAQVLRVDPVPPGASDMYDQWALYHAGLADRLRTDETTRAWYQERETRVLETIGSSLVSRSHLISEYGKDQAFSTEDEILVWSLTWRHVLYGMLGQNVHPSGTLYSSTNGGLALSEVVRILRLIQDTGDRLFFTQMRADLAWERALFSLP